ncbi:MAG: hypothetical protein Q7S27_02060 [Nanoarchaeota archaeon]|nr:hypothetical protein [Nanoarchaeota archaeon]
MEKIRVNMILEILGRPVEHVKESLLALLSKLQSDAGVKIVNKHIHDPIPVENSKDLFTSFVELELELESWDVYFGVMFAYMPSNIEIVHPQKLPFSNIDFNTLASKLITRLHEYDAITKKALMENEILIGKLQEVAPHLFKKSEVPSAPPIKTEQKKSSKKRSKKA